MARAKGEVMTDAKGLACRGGGGILQSAPGSGSLNFDPYPRRRSELDAVVAGAKAFSDGTFGELRV